MRTESGLQLIDQLGLHVAVEVGNVQANDVLASASRKFSSRIRRCFFSMTNMTSAQPMCPSLTRIRERGSVPADLTAYPSLEHVLGG